MSNESVLPRIINREANTVGNGEPKEELADFSTDTRVLLLSAMAIVTGVMGAVAAYVLLWPS